MRTLLDCNKYYYTMKTFWRCSILFVLVVPCIVSGCVWLMWGVSADRLSNYGVSEEDLKDVQFYIGETAVFAYERTETAPTERKGDKGDVKFYRSSETIRKTIKLKAGTPGICVDAKLYSSRGWIDVDFGDGVILRFTDDDWPHGFVLTSKSIRIDGNTYEIKDYDRQRLRVNKTLYRDHDTKTESKTVRGKKIGS